jgi:hypothetical protein
MSSEENKPPTQPQQLEQHQDDEEVVQEDPSWVYTETIRA